MEACRKVLVAFTVVLLAVALVADAQTVCRINRQGLNACKPSVSGRKPTPPSAACCSALSKADLPCLCRYKRSPLLRFYGIDTKRALQLPAKCGLRNPKC